MFFEIFMIGFGLSMDAVAVSMTNGMVFKGCNAKRASIIALSFGLFQGIMPLIGFLGGSFFCRCHRRLRSLDCINPVVHHRRKNDSGFYTVR